MAIEILTDKQKNLLDRIKNEGHKIGHLIGYDDLTEFHSKLIKEIVCGKENASYCIHRGAYTSSTICLGIALHILTRPNSRILLVTETEENAKFKLIKIENILKSDTFQAFSIIIYGHGFEVKLGDWGYLETTLGTNIVKNQLRVISTNDSLAGMHEKDLYIVDNLISIIDRKSKATKDLKTEIISDIKQFDGRSIIFGSTWEYDDFYSTLDNVQVFDCYDTRLLTEEQIKEIKLSMTPSLFAAQYLCNPYKEIYTKGNQAKLEKLASKMYRLSLKNEDITDIKAEMQEIIDNCEIIYRYDNRRKL